MKIRGVAIEDTFAEAFTMRAARVVITGRTPRWAREAALKMTGFATSVIGCKCEAGIERELAPDETPDGRPGISVLLLTMDKDASASRLIERIGQTVLTCPTTACFDGLPEAPDRVGVGRRCACSATDFRRASCWTAERYWRIPVMEGEFLVEEKFGLQKGIGGGNFLILATDGGRGARGGRSGGRRDGGHAGRHPSVPRRDRSQRQQGGLAADQDDDRVHQRRLLPDAARGHRDRAARRR